jgi:uncharacterized protein (DUF3084 family)
LHAYSILLIGAWILGSGIVAYVCDNLGRKLGKRRLSLWGLRPRHTAMVVTVLTGISIAAVTVGFVALVSADARQALFEVISLSQQADSLKETQRNLTVQNRGLRRETANLTQAAADAKVESTRATRAMEEAKKQRDKVREELASSRKRLAVLEKSRTGLKTQVRELQNFLQNLARQLQGSEKRLAQSKEEVEKTKATLEQVKSDLAQSNAKYGTVQAQYNNAEKELLATQGDLKLAQSDLKDAQQELNDQKAVIEENKTQLASLNDQLKSTQDLLNDEIKRLTDIQSRLVSIRAESVIFYTGQEIARRVIYQPDDETEVSGELDKLLKSADDAVQAQGGKGATLLPAGAISATGTQAFTDQEEKLIMKVLVRKIVSDGKDVLVRALVSANAVAGDAVQMILDVSPNTLAFRRGDVIASREIDGRLSQAKILEAMLDLLRNQVRGKALAVGLNPPPSGTIGEINWDMMLDTVRRIQKSRKTCEVQVVAQSDAWTADPLLVRFEVHR